MPTPMPDNARRCKRCKTEYPSSMMAQMCCLFAPEPQGWCAWCGKTCPDSFCSSACSVSFQEDVLSQKLDELDVKKVKASTPKPKKKPAKPKKQVKWCQWCGKDCVTTFCSTICERAYRYDVIGSVK